MLHGLQLGGVGLGAEEEPELRQPEELVGALPVELEEEDASLLGVCSRFRPKDIIRIGN